MCKITYVKDKKPALTSKCSNVLIKFKAKMNLFYTKKYNSIRCNLVKYSVLIIYLTQRRYNFIFLVIFVFHFALIGAKSKGLDLEDEFDGSHHLNIHNQSFFAFHDCHCLLHFEPCYLFAREKVTILYTFPYLILSYF